MTERVKGKLGRPTLQDEDKRGMTIRVRVKPAEHKKLKSLAKPQTVSAYLREKGLAS